jgi:hypothetical protein
MIGSILLLILVFVSRVDSLAQVSLQVDSLGTNAARSANMLRKMQLGSTMKASITRNDYDDASLHNLSRVSPTAEANVFLYPRNPDYVHPLDAVGQYLEKKAVANLNSDLVSTNLESLLEFPTRSYADRDQSSNVEEFLARSFGSAGLMSCRHSFGRDDAHNVELLNVLAFLQGSSEETVTIGAHYDDLPLSAGADDNGSGVAALLAIANATSRAFADAMMKPVASIYFVAFGAGQGGNLGSTAFADALFDGVVGIDDRCKSSGSTSINTSHHHVIVMDRVGRTETGSPSVLLQSQAWTKPIMDHLRESSQRHNGDALQVMETNRTNSGDHTHFLSNNISAVLTTSNIANTHLPPLNDTIGSIDENLIYMISKMNLGALIRLAGVQPLEAPAA